MKTLPDAKIAICVRCYGTGRMHECDFSKCFACGGFGWVTSDVADLWQFLLYEPSTPATPEQIATAYKKFSDLYNMNYSFLRDGHWNHGKYASS